MPERGGVCFIMAVLDIYPAAAIRGARVLGRKARPAPARVALLALIPAAGGLALASGAAPALAAGPAPSCSAGTCTVSFTTPGTGQSFTVPAGVSSLAVTLYGGVGGSTYFTQSPVAGGDGAQVTATLTVHAGERLGVDVGGAGTTTTDTLGASTAGGANGGGDGFDSGGGGGATDITAGGTRLVVAGGGGGAGTTQPAFVGICLGDFMFAAGGAGGNADNPGAAGQSVSGDIPLPGNSGTDHETMEGGHGGAPGTTAGPGAGGLYGFPETSSGSGNCLGDAGGTGGNGSGTAGGSGSEDPNDGGTDENGGGGGGIGAFGVGDAGGGGGGGGYFGGGAGGSGASEISSLTTTAGSGGGGGGASYTAGAGVGGALVSDAGNSGQVNGGNGEVTFSYADPTAADLTAGLSCPPSLGPGQSGPCTLTVVNHGPSAASNLTASLTLPANVTEVSCTGGCTPTRSLLTWAAPSLAAGASVSYTVTVKAAKPGTAQLTGTAAARNVDPHPQDNTATATIAVKQ
jgi:hypothetical protein